MSQSKKIVIDLNQIKEQQLNERILRKWVGDVKLMLLNLFGVPLRNLGFSVKGSPTQINSFMGALSGEKRYMQSYIKHGLNDPKTLRSRHALSRSVTKFERETGLRWPFK